MNLRALSILGTVSALMAPLLAPATASAQEADGARFRGGVSLAGGPFILTGGGSTEVIGSIALSGQLGVQINHNWAVYAMPELGGVFGGGVAGGTLALGVLGEYTFSAAPISIGAGPYGGVLFVPSSGDGDEGGALGGYAGAKLHLAAYPILVRGDNGIRRNALAVAFDLGVYSAIGGGGLVLISPTVSVGFLAF